MARHREYYKGEGGGFSQVEAVVSLVIRACPWFVRAPKVLQLRTNQLIIWFVQACVNSDPLVICFSPYLGAPTRPSTHKILQTRERIPTH